MCKHEHVATASFYTHKVKTLFFFKSNEQTSAPSMCYAKDDEQLPVSTI